MKIHAQLLPGTALLLALTSPGLPAQAPDEGSLVIRAGDREVGGESFRVVLTEGRVRISSKAVYPDVQPPVEWTVSSERNESGGLAFQLSYRGRTTTGEVYAVQERTRLTIRRVERGIERASEVPGGAAVVLLADSTFAPFLQVAALATEHPRTLSAIFPLTGRRVAIHVRRSASPAGGSQVDIEGGVVASILLGNRGELLRISLPALGMEASRRQN